jgi:uncharacterized protein (TIGR04255 family)
MLRTRSADLPDFREPPVAEVYLSIQFGPIAGFDATQMSKCCEAFGAAFPQVRYQQPLGHDIEQFGAPAPVMPSALQFQIGATQDLYVRLALTSDDGARLLQIQPDRLVHNWRRQGNETDYPRYESIRDAFEKHTQTFWELIARAGLSAPVIDQCEISYINHIDAPEERGGVSGAARVFSQLQAVPGAGDSLPQLEDMGLRARYIVKDRDQNLVGRLHTLAQPSYRVSNSPGFHFSLMVRGRPPTPTLDGAVAFFDLGRRTIVRAFAALTTPEMHKVWGRADAAT